MTSAQDSSAARSGLWLILQTGVALCFIGHGAFGLITKQAWVPYFGVAGISEAWAWKLMPWIGAMDVAVGFLAFIWPCRALFVWAALWTVWTALLRPLAGQGWPEFFERAGNYGVPISILVLIGVRGGWFARLPEQWLARTFHTYDALTARLASRSGDGPVADSERTATRTSPLHEIFGLRLTDSVHSRLAWTLRLTTATLLTGHAACALMLHKAGLAHHYDVFGVVETTAVMLGVGWFELLLALAVLMIRAPGVLIFACLWKLATECLFLTSGAVAPMFEVIERGGSYVAPLALAYLLTRRKSPARIASTPLPNNQLSHA